MAKITAADVNKLRKQTGAGMMDCKKALVEAEGDFEQAIDILRKKGQKVAAKRADRDANEGRVVAKINAEGNFGVVLALSCETDFVAKNQDFIDFSEKLIDLAVASKMVTVEEFKAIAFEGEQTVEEAITEMIGKTGEKMEIADYGVVEGPTVSAYNHQGNRLATIVGLSAAGFNDAGHQVAMQIAAMNPLGVDETSVDEKVIAHELELGKETARQEGKPEAIIEKIAMGKVQKFLKENTLLEQPFVRDNKINVRDFLNNTEKGLTVSAFKRAIIGA